MIKGFRFGMLLQIAVGPICFFIFQTAASSGFLIAETGVMGVALIDALYILLAILGLGAIIEKSKKAKTFLTLFGSVILILFGLSTFAGVFQIHFLPGLSLETAKNNNSVFVKTTLLTLSNPLTIVFWTGVLGTKIAEENMGKKELYLFGAGAVLSTLFFLSMVACLGGFLQNLLNTLLINTLNIGVGLLLIFFGIKSLWNYYHKSYSQ